jgi:hypothetical protein
MSEADKHMLGIEGLELVPWSDFGEKVGQRREMEFKAIEQRRFEECSVSPGPSNDVMVGIAVVVSRLP